MKRLNIDLTNVLITSPPFPFCLGPLTKIKYANNGPGVVQANFFTWTIRSLISLVWSKWSKWSKQIQHIAHVRARTRVCIDSFILVIVFKLIKKTRTTWTTSIKSTLFAWTTAWTNLDHLDQKGNM